MTRSRFPPICFGTVWRKARKLLVAVVAVVIVFGVVISTIGPSPGFPNLPTPNGHDDFVEAGKAIKGDPSRWSNLTQEELQRLVATNAISLRLLHLGLTRRCSVPTAQVLRTFRHGECVFDLIPLAQLKAAEGHLAEMEGRQVDAAQCYLADVQLGNEITRGGFLIDLIEGITSETIGGKRLANLAHQLTPDLV